jgi:hypothetical protein
VELRHLDQKLRTIKSDMSGLLQKKNPDYQPEEIEKIFHRFDDAAGTVNQTLEKAKTQHQSAQLASILGKKIELDIKSRLEDKKKEEKREPEKPAGPRNITEELYGGSMLSKRVRWDGSIVYQEEAPSLMRAESRQEEPKYFMKTLSAIREQPELTRRASNIPEEEYFNP